jgi:hypothetical protein
MVLISNIFCHAKISNLDRIKKPKKTYVTLELLRMHVCRCSPGDNVIDHR